MRDRSSEALRRGRATSTGGCRPTRPASCTTPRRATHAGEQIVEIGSFRGRSTIVLASGAPDGVAVVAIDPHAGNDRGPQEIDGLRRRGRRRPRGLHRQPGRRPVSPTGSATCARSATPRTRDVRRRRRRAVRRRRPPLRPGARRHPRLGRAGRARRHDADPRLVLVGRRHAGDRARAAVRSAGSATSAGRGRWPSTAPTSTAVAQPSSPTPRRQLAAAAVVRQEPRSSRCC